MALQPVAPHLAMTPSASGSGALNSPELTAYYENRPLMWRNLGHILILNLGWSVAFTVVGPLMQLRVNSAGLGTTGIGIVSSINSWAYSFLVMYFAWKSDHTVSRLGRRLPYLLISAPAILLSLVLFPMVDAVWLLTGLWLMKMLFTDIKAATVPLLSIDCMPRRMLARTAAPAAMLSALLSFFALRYGVKLSEFSEWMPYYLAATVLLVATVIGVLRIKEPPIKNPTTEKFRPWSTMKVAWHDRRKVVLMVAVSMFQTFQIVFGAWIWLYATNRLGLSRPEIAHAMSWAILCGVGVAFPISWLIDRISPYRLLPVFCLINGAVLWAFLNIEDVNGLILTACLQVIAVPFYNAADIMVYRTVNPADMGSVTSTNSCLRGFYNGGIAILMGWLIHRGGGNYDLAYIIAFGLTAAGLIPLFYYRRLMREKPAATTPDLLSSRDAPAEIPLMASAPPQR